MAYALEKERMANYYYVDSQVPIIGWLMFKRYLQFPEPENGFPGLGCTRGESRMPNHVGPNSSHKQG